VRPLDQLLELAFDRRIADMFVLQDTVGVDGEGVGERFDCERC
jgi:hypothetical protein